MTPADLLNIAGKSVIRPGMLKNTSTYGRPELLGMSTMAMDTAEDGQPVYFVKQTDSKVNSFKAYVCDYGEGQLNYQVLSTEADFCFTTTINGCTFALGMPASDGTLIVSHTNMKSDKMDKADLVTRGTASQASFQGDVAGAFHGRGVMVDPSVYWAGGDTADGSKINVTVFGIRTNTGWNFYYQRWTRRSGGINKLIDLNNFDVNNKTF